MKLLSVKLKDFRQHGDTCIEFPDGLTAILGPNGSGKTTILEAIAWALYGPVAVRGTKDTIRRRAAAGKKEVCVELCFEFANQTYTVVRTLDRATLAIDGSVVKDGVSEVTEGIKALLHMDYQAFFNSFFTQQKQLSFMANMDGRQRATAISRMLGYERVAKAREAANSDKLGYSREIEGLEKGLGDWDEIQQAKSISQIKLADAEERVKEAESDAVNKKLAFERLKPEIESGLAKKQAYDAIVEKGKRAKQEQDFIQNRISELEKDLKKNYSEEAELKDLEPIVKEFEALQEEHSRLAELQKYESERQKIIGEINALENDEKRLIAKLAESADAKEKLAEYSDAVSKTNAEIERFEAEALRIRDEKTAKLKSLEAEAEECKRRKEEFRSKRKQIEAAGKEGKCPTCERPLHDELPIVLAGFDEQIRQIDGRLEDIYKAVKVSQEDLETTNRQIALKRAELNEKLRSQSEKKIIFDSEVRQIEEIQNELAKKRQTLKSRREQLQKIPTGFDQERFEKIIQRGKELRSGRDRARELMGSVQRKPNVEGELESQKARMQGLAEQIIELKKQLSELNFDPKTFEELQAKFENAQEELRKAELELERKRSDARTAKAELEAAQSQETNYKRKKAVLEELRKKRLYAEVLAKTLDDFRTYLNQRARPDLEAKASEILSDLTNGRYNALEIDDNYQATVIDDGERKPVISGGEDDVVNLSLRLAISEMISEKAGQPLSLLVLDEVFGSLDESRRENVVNLLQNLKNRFQQIILITHIESIHDMVDNCIAVEYDEKSKTCVVKDGNELFGSPNIVLSELISNA